MYVFVWCRFAQIEAHHLSQLYDVWCIASTMNYERAREREKTASGGVERTSIQYFLLCCCSVDSISVSEYFSGVVQCDDIFESLLLVISRDLLANTKARLWLGSHHSSPDFFFSILHCHLRFQCTLNNTPVFGIFRFFFLDALWWLLLVDGLCTESVLWPSKTPTMPCDRWLAEHWAPMMTNKITAADTDENRDKFGFSIHLIAFHNRNWCMEMMTDDSLSHQH